MIVDLKEQIEKSEYYGSLVMEADGFMEKYYPECVPLDPMIRIDVEIISIDLVDKKFRNIIDSYGYKYVVGLIEFLTTKEEYELCKELVEALQEHNKRNKSSLPTSILGFKEMKR